MEKTAPNTPGPPLKVEIVGSTHSKRALSFRPPSLSRVVTTHGFDSNELGVSIGEEATVCISLKKNFLFLNNLVRKTGANLDTSQRPSLSLPNPLVSETADKFFCQLVLGASGPKDPSITGDFKVYLPSSSFAGLLTTQESNVSPKILSL